MNNTLKITLLATALFSLSANAAQFVMQVKSPSGIVVAEGNKGSEVPVVPEAGQPTVNFIKVLSSATNEIETLTGNIIGYPDNSSCVNGSQTHFRIITENGKEPVIEGIINDILYAKDTAAASLKYPYIQIEKMGERVIQNTKTFYHDSNLNNEFDDNEIEFYVGELAHEYTVLEEHNSLYNLCSKN